MKCSENIIDTNPIKIQDADPINPALSDKGLSDANVYTNTSDNFLADGYMEDNEESTDLWEYIEDTPEFSI